MENNGAAIVNGRYRGRRRTGKSHSDRMGDSRNSYRPALRSIGVYLSELVSVDYPEKGEAGFHRPPGLDRAVSMFRSEPGRKYSPNHRVGTAALNLVASYSRRCGS
jgi:hypothetical protein